ncbi:MAG: mechanosensitive ion channel, partial [Chloroflexi bacterium]|nr:mechanosensitive ion channel [Chloroflexota bacterium]
MFNLDNEYSIAIIIAIATVIVAVVLEIGLKIAKSRIRGGAEDFDPPPKYLVLNALDGPLILIILLIGGTYSGSIALDHWQIGRAIDADLAMLVRRIGSVAVIATAAFVATRISSLLLDWYSTHVADATSTHLDDQLVPSFKRMLPILIYALAILWSLAVFEIQISPLLATLGIGGIAIALAAQP